MLTVAVSLSNLQGGQMGCRLHSFLSLPDPFCFCSNFTVCKARRVHRQEPHLQTVLLPLAISTGLTMVTYRPPPFDAVVLEAPFARQVPEGTALPLLMVSRSSTAPLLGVICSARLPPLTARPLLIVVPTLMTSIVALGALLVVACSSLRPAPCTWDVRMDGRAAMPAEDMLGSRGAMLSPEQPDDEPEPNQAPPPDPEVVVQEDRLDASSSTHMLLSPHTQPPSSSAVLLRITVLLISTRAMLFRLTCNAHARAPG